MLSKTEDNAEIIKRFQALRQKTDEILGKWNDLKDASEITRENLKEEMEEELDNLQEKYEYKEVDKLREKMAGLKKEMFEDYLNKNKDILKRIKKEHLDWEVKLLKDKISRSQEILEINNSINELEGMKGEIEKDIRFFENREKNVPETS